MNKRVLTVINLRTASAASVLFATLGIVVSTGAVAQAGSEPHTAAAVIADDEGPGIAYIRQALRDGFSTSGSLGLGLPGVRRLMDEFEITSQPGKGTTVMVKKWRP